MPFGKYESESDFARVPEHLLMGPNYVPVIERESLLPRIKALELRIQQSNPSNMDLKSIERELNLIQLASWEAKERSEDIGSNARRAIVDIQESLHLLKIQMSESDFEGSSIAGIVAFFLDQVSVGAMDREDAYTALIELQRKRSSDPDIASAVRTFVTALWPANEAELLLQSTAMVQYEDSMLSYSGASRWEPGGRIEASFIESTRFVVAQLMQSLNEIFSPGPFQAMKTIAEILSTPELQTPISPELQALKAFLVDTRNEIATIYEDSMTQEFDAVLQNVAIFTPGTHIDSLGTEKTFSREDLEHMVDAFNRKAPPTIPVKMGHSSDEFNQQVADAMGIPAVLAVGEGSGGKGQVRLGEITALHLNDTHLTADLRLSDKVGQLVKDKLFTGVSAEIQANRRQGEEVFPTVLSGLALLGAQRPALANLPTLQQATMLDDGSSADNVFTFDSDFAGIENEPFTSSMLRSAIEVFNDLKAGILSRDYALTMVDSFLFAGKNDRGRTDDALRPQLVRDLSAIERIKVDIIRDFGESNFAVIDADESLLPLVRSLENRLLQVDDMGNLLDDPSQGSPDLIQSELNRLLMSPRSEELGPRTQMAIADVQDRINQILANPVIRREHGGAWNKISSALSRLGFSDKPTVKANDYNLFEDGQTVVSGAGDGDKLFDIPFHDFGRGRHVTATVSAPDEITAKRTGLRVVENFLLSATGPAGGLLGGAIGLVVGKNLIMGKPILKPIGAIRGLIKWIFSEEPASEFTFPEDFNLPTSFNVPFEATSSGEKARWLNAVSSFVETMIDGVKEGSINQGSALATVSEVASSLNAVLSQTVGVDTHTTNIASKLLSNARNLIALMSEEPVPTSKFAWDMGSISRMIGPGHIPESDATSQEKDSWITWLSQTILNLVDDVDRGFMNQGAGMASLSVLEDRIKEANSVADLDSGVFQRARLLMDTARNTMSSFNEDDISSNQYASVEGEVDTLLIKSELIGDSLDKGTISEDQAQSMFKDVMLGATLIGGAAVVGKFIANVVLPKLGNRFPALRTIGFEDDISSNQYGFWGGDSEEEKFVKLVAKAEAIGRDSGMDIDRKGQQLAYLSNFVPSEEDADDPRYGWYAFTAIMQRIWDEQTDPNKGHFTASRYYRGPGRNVFSTLEETMKSTQYAAPEGVSEDAWESCIISAKKEGIENPEAHCKAKLSKKEEAPKLKADKPAEMEEKSMTKEIARILHLGESATLGQIVTAITRLQSQQVDFGEHQQLGEQVKELQHTNRVMAFQEETKTLVHTSGDPKERAEKLANLFETAGEEAAIDLLASWKETDKFAAQAGNTIALLDGSSDNDTSDFDRALSKYQEENPTITYAEALKASMRATANGTH